jgi:hypothetical protein
LDGVSMSIQLDVELINGQKHWSGNIENIGELLDQATFEVLRDFRAAFLKASRTSTEYITRVVLPTVALYVKKFPQDREPGRLRAGFLNALETNIDVSISQKKFDAEYKFNTTRLIDSVFEDGHHYSAEHIVQHPESRWPGGRYNKSSTPNTRPIDLRFWEAVSVLMGNEFIRNIILWGYDLG